MIKPFFFLRNLLYLIKKAVYIAIGVQMDGVRDVLGMWVGENESAKFWLGITQRIKEPGCLGYPDCLCGRADRLSQRD